MHSSSNTKSCLCQGPSICLWLCIFHCLSNCLLVGQVMSPHQSDQISQKSQVSWITIWICSLNVFVFVFVFIFFIVFFCGQVIFHHHYDHMSQKSELYRITLWMSSLNVFVFVIVSVFVFIFVIVFILSGHLPWSLWLYVSKVTNLWVALWYQKSKRSLYYIKVLK